MTSPNVMVKICKLFYKEGLSKTEIEKRLHISRFKVASLLKKAQKIGMVKIEIVEPKSNLNDLEERLEQATGLKNVILVWNNSDSTKELKEKIGRAAADYLMEVIGKKDVLGIGWGTTTSELVRALPDAVGKQVSIVQVSGGISKLESGIDSQALTVRMAQKFGTKPHLLYAPAILDQLETRQMLMKESSLKEVFQLYKKIKLLIAGIGALLPDQFVGSWSNDPKEMDNLRRQGAVAELLSYCFDLKGRLCTSETFKRTIAIPPEDIKRVPCVIGLAVGSKKADAVLGVVRSGYINTLITDTTIAKAILEKIGNQTKGGIA